MINKKKTGVIACVLTLVASLMSPVGAIRAKADYWPDSISVSSESAVVIDVSTGTILYEKNPHERLYPASITKIMTALLALENCPLDDTVVFSADAVYKNEGGTSHIARDLNEEMTMEWTLYGMMLESANECAWAIGEHVSGDIESFSNLMNERARELGCTDTTFNNPNGLPDEKHLTSAHDMALIAREAYLIPKFAEIVGTKNYVIPKTNKHPDAETPLNNHHKMLHNYKTTKYLYSYCTGGKTGYTDNSRYTLVTYAKKDDMTLACVVMMAQAEEDQYRDTRALFDYCFDNFASYNISKNQVISNSSADKLTGSLEDTINLIKIDSESTIILPKTASFTDATSEIYAQKNPNNPSSVGKMRYIYDGREVGSADIIFESAKTNAYPFFNIPIEEGGGGIDYFTFNYKLIFISSIAVLVFILLIIFIHSKAVDIRIYSHRRFGIKHKPKTDFKKINRSYAQSRRGKTTFHK